MEQNIGTQKHAQWIQRLIIGLAHLYCLWVLSWAGLYFFWNNHWWIFLLNCSAIYFFFPLPLLLILAVLRRRRILWLEFSILFIVGMYFYHGVLWPNFPQKIPASPHLTVMTFNLKGKTVEEERLPRIITDIQTADADVIALQELPPSVADILRHELLSEYPYQWFEPQTGAQGRGVMSRYPLHSSHIALPDQGVHTPQILDVCVAGTMTTLINVHTPSLYTLNRQGFLNKRNITDQQMEVIVTLAAQQSQPMIVLGDFNVSERSRAYTIIHRTLTDAWREAGWGFGHTYPGALTNDLWSGFITFHDHIPLLVWSVRLDYIFHSDGWRTIAAWIGPWDHSSDHRPVLATLALQPIQKAQEVLSVSHNTDLERIHGE